MSNATASISTRDNTRMNRAAFVAATLKSERWSVRAAAMAIGTSHTSLGSRIKGETAFLAEDIESLAIMLNRDPVVFYGEYLRAGSEGPNPRTLVPKIVGSSGNVAPIRRNEGSHASVAQGIEHWFPVPVAARSNRAGGTIINFPTRATSPVERERLAPVTSIVAL